MLEIFTKEVKVDLKNAAVFRLQSIVIVKLATADELVENAGEDELGEMLL